jgi:uncharacterized protein YaaR (DUF327 family)
MVDLTTEGLQAIADTVQKEVTDDVTIEGDQDQMNETDQKAFDAGWRPQTEWEGDPEDWVSAKEYLRVGEMMDRIKSQGSQLRSYTKKMDQMESAMKELGEHNKKIAEQEYNKALQDLKSLKSEALELGDYDTVVEIDDKMGDLKQTNPANQPEPQPESNPVVDAWLEDNTWYEQDVVMRGAADAMMQQITSSTPGIEPTVVLGSVLEKMKEEFPHKFGSIKQAGVRTTTTESSPDGTARARTTQKGSSKYTARHLSPEQQRIGKTFVRTGALESLDVYAQQLGDIGELEVQQGGA